jgi:protocatechuate 3,4-dioxygenase beta subunit
MRLAGVFPSVLAFATGSLILAYAQTPTPGQIPQPGQTQPGQPQPPTRTPARPLRPGEAPPKGTAVIRGQVLAADSGAPIRRAQIRAVAPESRSTGVANTDKDGRFEITELPGGRYTITATKGGFVSMQYGQRRPNEAGTPIELADGQMADKVNFALPRGGAITGRILDEFGEPVAGIQVTAMRYGFMAGARRLVPASGEGAFARTDDLGSYRLYGLAPGDYYVSATDRGGMIVGGGGGTVAVSLAGVEPEGFAPTYYPGTPNIAEAQRISIRAGLEAAAPFSLVVARLARITGRVVNSRGEPLPRGMVLLAPADSSVMSMSIGPSNMLAADGSFAMTNVVPGRYNLTVRPMGLPSASDEFATMPLTVGSEDIENVMVVASVGGTARGTIVTDDGSLPPFRADAVQLIAAPMEPGIMIAGNNLARVNDDYSFEMTGLFDRRAIRSGPTNTPGWYLKGVYVDGTDVTDTGIEVQPGREVAGIQVVFTQRTTTLSGLVTDDRGRPVLDASVVVFAANRDRWTYQSRYVRAARPDTEGRYSIPSLPPDDDYRIIAVRNLESGQGSDPEFLARALDEAERFALAEGETKVVDIKVSPLVP